MNNKDLLLKLQTYNIIFWDFDGVIKDSNDTKGEAFVDLFKDAPLQTQSKIREHHFNNQGVSRYKKIPYYLELAGIEQSDELIQKYLKSYSLLTIDKVIESPYIPGVLEYISENSKQQEFHIVTGTSEIDILEITSKLKIEKYFKTIQGSPKEKIEIIRPLLKTNSNCLMIGDSNTDYEAATYHSLDFLLLNSHDEKLKALSTYFSKNLLS